MVGPDHTESPKPALKLPVTACPADVDDTMFGVTLNTAR